jgi:hypothetical protein
MNDRIDGNFPLENILLDAELRQRPSRPVDHAATNRALESIARELSNPGARILKALTDATLALCDAHSAGISILESDGGHPVFRWHAISGAWSGFEGGCLPRNASPCGVVLDTNAAHLMRSPERHFVDVRGAEPKIHEVLLAPFHVMGEAVGTVWVLSHDESRRFDAEDLRRVGQVAPFAAAAYCLMESQRNAVQNANELARYNERLVRENRRLQAATPD